MTQESAETPIPELEEPTDQQRPATWSSALRLGLKRRYLVLVAVILLTVGSFIGWIAWNELKLPANLFAVLPPSDLPVAAPEPLPIPPAPAAEVVPAVPQPAAPPDDARMDRLEELLKQNIELMEQMGRALQANEDAHLYLAEKVDQIEDMKANSDSLSALMYNIAMQVESLSPYAGETAAAVEEPTVPSIPDSPPFELLAIDKWQHDWYAVLELDGQVTMVTPPASRAGWELLRLDPTSRKALFRNSASGTEHELAIR